MKDIKGHRIHVFIGSHATFGDVKGTVTRAWWGDRKSDGMNAINLEVDGVTYKDVQNVRFKHASTKPLFMDAPITVDGSTKRKQHA